MLEPDCTAGRLISLNPERGPEESKPQIVADLRQFQRGALEHPRHLNERADVLRGLDEIAGVEREKPVMVLSFSHTRDAYLGWALRSRADGGAPEVDLGDDSRSLEQPFGVLTHHDRVGAELLTEGHRHRILQLVRPIFMTELNSVALRPKAAASSSRGRMQSGDEDLQRHLDGGGGRRRSCFD